MTKVSIILPIYNVEKYLRRCIDSVLSQTLPDIEVILGTDGPEACDEICKEYAQKDPRVKVIFHPGSYGKAFNRGVQLATGEYIGIVETDDWIAPNMYEKMYHKAKANDADVVKCGFFGAFDDPTKNFTVLHESYNEHLDIQQEQRFLSSQPSVWSCIYKKDFLISKKISMVEERQSFIDVPFHYETICKATKYILLKEPLYYYYQDNVNQSVQNVKVYDGLNSEIYALSLIKSKQIPLLEGVLYSMAMHLKWNYDRLRRSDRKLFLKKAHQFITSLDTKNLKYIYFEENLKFFFELLIRKEYFNFNKELQKLNSPTKGSLWRQILSITNVENHKVFHIAGLSFKIKKSTLKKFLETLFSIKNENTNKVITMLGIKFKCKSKKLLRKCALTHRNELPTCNDEKSQPQRDHCSENQEEVSRLQNVFTYNRTDTEKTQKIIQAQNAQISKITNFINKFIDFLDMSKNDLEIQEYSTQNSVKNIEIYDQNFYKINAAESYDSALKVLNIFRQYYLPQSVLDLGCGVGTWLKAWQNYGVKNILGMDANQMPDEVLCIPRAQLKIIDFENDDIVLTEHFDLAMSLECFEHISHQQENKAFTILTNAADLILFSAAIPFQVGTNHINSHKLSYWANKFKERGFKCYDIIRPECIKNALNIGAWYTQNILVFAKNEKAETLEKKGAVPIETPIMFYHSKILQDILIVNKI